MRILQKIKHYLWEPRFYFSRFQFNLVALFFITVGFVGGTYLALSEIYPRVFALNDSNKVWTFNAANAGDYTASQTVVDNSGAHPTGGTEPAISWQCSMKRSMTVQETEPVILQLPVVLLLTQAWG